RPRMLAERPGGRHGAVSNATPEARLLAAGLALPPAPQPRGSYAPFCRCPSTDGLRMAMISGQTSRIDGGMLAGLCDAGVDLAAARHAARVAMLNGMAALRAAC